MEQSWHSYGTLTRDLCFKTVPNTCVRFQLIFQDLQLLSFCLCCRVILSSDNSSKDILHMDCVEWGAQNVSQNAVELDGPMTRDLCFKTVPNTCVVFSWQLFFLGLKCGGILIMILGIALSGASVIKQYQCNLFPFHCNY